MIKDQTTTQRKTQMYLLKLIYTQTYNKVLKINSYVFKWKKYISSVRLKRALVLMAQIWKQRSMDQYKFSGGKEI